MTRISDDPLLVALGQARDRIYAARAGGDSPLFNLVAELHAYREALARCDLPAHRLVQAKAELHDRLADGWQKVEATPTLEYHWLALLVRYEAVCDALDVPATRRRLSSWEATHYMAGPRSAATPTVARQ